MYDSIQTLIAAVIEAQDFDEMGCYMLEAFQQLAGVEAAYLTRVDPHANTQHILAARHGGEVFYEVGEVLPWTDSLCAYALASGEPHVWQAATRWPEATGSARHSARDYFCHPIKTDAGELFGTLCGLDRLGHATSTQELQATLSLFTGLLSRELPATDQPTQPSDARSFPGVSTADMTLMDRLTDLTRRTDKLQVAVTELARLELERARWPRAVPFYCIDGQPEASWVGDNAVVARLGAVLADLDSGDGASRGSRDGLTLDANLVSTQRLRVEAGLAPRGISIVLCATTPTGLHGGVILMDERLSLLPQGEAWLIRQCCEHLSLLAGRLESDTALAEANTQLERNATRDSLTGLRNRRYLIEELERILAQADRLGEMIHVAFITLDGFKELNDRYGHEMGDHMLVDVAQRLIQTTRASDIVARYGGDEFVVVGPGITPSRAEFERQRLGERLTQATTGQYELPGLTLDYEGPSVGGATSEPGDMDPDRLLALAEEAMYAAKEERRWTGGSGSRVTS